MQDEVLKSELKNGDDSTKFHTAEDGNTRLQVEPSSSKSKQHHGKHHKHKSHKHKHKRKKKSSSRHGSRRSDNEYDSDTGTEDGGQQDIEIVQLQQKKEKLQQMLLEQERSSGSVRTSPSLNEKERSGSRDRSRRYHEREDRNQGRYREDRTSTTRRRHDDDDKYRSSRGDRHVDDNYRRRNHDGHRRRSRSRSLPRDRSYSPRRHNREHTSRSSSRRSPPPPTRSREDDAHSSTTTTRDDNHGHRGKRRRADDRSSNKGEKKEAEEGHSSDNMEDDSIIIPEEEEDEDTKIEKARKKRENMLKKLAKEKEAMQVVSSPTRVALEEREKQKAVVIEQPANNTCSQPSPVSLHSSLDLAQDTTTNKEIAATTTAESTVATNTDASAPQQPSVPKPISHTTSVDDDADMFGDAFDVAANETVQTGDYRDNWDDTEGYYKIRPGEILNSKYKVIGFTGQGVFSNVVRAQDTTTKDTIVAIKIVRNNDLMHKAGLKELEIVKKLNDTDKSRKHNCVKLLCHFVHKGHLCMVFENLFMNLREVTKRYGRDEGEVVGLAMPAVQKYATHLLRSLKLMRHCKVIHADIKPDNILINHSKTHVKLCDFGSACYIAENDPTPYLVSRFYRAPEIILGHKYDFAIDMWALGCTLFELYTGRILFNEPTNNTMLRAHMELKGKLSNKFVRKGLFKLHHFDEANNFLLGEINKVTNKERVRSIQNVGKTTDLMSMLKKVQATGDADERRKLNQLKDLIEQMLTLDPEKRITPKEALNHPFIVEKMYES